MQFKNIQLHKVLVATLFSLCIFPSHSALAESAADKAQTAISTAIKAQKKAASVGGQWRDTSKLIKKAKKLLSNGKPKKALKLANTAKKQGLLGYRQAVAQNAKNLHI